MNTPTLLDRLARLSSPQLAQVEQFISAFASPLPSQPKCDCHVIDPSKTTILIFPCSDPKHSDSLIVKFNGQKFIAPPRKDKNGAKYWKARDFYEVDSKTLDPWETKLTKAGFTLEKPNKLVKSYQEKVEQKCPMSEFSMAEIKAYSKWSEEQEKAKASLEPKVESQSTPTPENTQKSEVKDNHETTSNQQ